MSDPQTTDPTPPTAPDATAAPETPPPAAPVEPVVELVPRTPITVAEAERVVWRFVGPDAIDGIPPRDLTVLDMERLEPSQLRELAPPLYERA